MSLLSSSPAKPLIPGVEALESALSPFAEPLVRAVAGLIEVFGGLALAFGLLTRVAAALVFALMAVAVIWVHLPVGYFWMTGGLEYPLMWGLIALAFVFRGGGAYSIDALIGREV